MSLKKLRKEIDKTDIKLMKAYRERVALVEQVANYKKENNIAIEHGNREKELVAELIKENGQEYKQDINAIYSTIMSISKLRQARVHSAKSIDGIICQSPTSYRGNKTGLTIAVQGLKGSYSMQAAETMFTDCKIRYCSSFEDVFEEISKKQADFGVIPIENSNAGSIHEVYDLLSSFKLYIVKAKLFPVSHYLIGKKNATIKDIKTVYSHRQALYQCKGYIKEKCFQSIETVNTALAAKTVSMKQDITLAAIASKEAANIYNLEIIDGNIQDENNNFTRFIAVAKENSISKRANKISLAVVLEHKKGALLQLLNIIASYNINMTKIESRPIPGSRFEFLFYFDIIANIEDKEVQAMLLDINESVKELKFLGGYEEE